MFLYVHATADPALFCGGHSVWKKIVRILYDLKKIVKFIKKNPLKEITRSTIVCIDCESQGFYCGLFGQFRMHARKLSMLDAMLDYDDAGANPKHERRGRPGGGGGRNP
ncbi:hypothetical protein Hanom_Chr06g00571461 [Helianthus anomalus]